MRSVALSQQNNTITLSALVLRGPAGKLTLSEKRSKQAMQQRKQQNKQAV
jgi:hypothetical protein